MSRCDDIAEALVMGEPLSADDEAHVEACAACQRLTALPAMLAASSGASPPRPGFSARMMAAARQRIAQRTRRRFATFTFALAAAAASAVAVDRLFVRPPVGTYPGSASKSPEPPLHEQRTPRSIAGYDRAMAPVANWDGIEGSAHKYRFLLRHGGPK
ncbi:MAG TPA: hypothetical protein VHE35_29115 [Kofleriaceae bacterium]|nr:hypothetical protein [Kofleriaceae bacterium]